jgi:two-component system CheB/CheR fusion protein
MSSEGPEAAPPAARTDTSPGQLVVIGSSAGGIEALSTLLGTLPPDFPAPVVLAQHLDPARQSHLQTILQRKTQLPIVLVTDQAPLEASHVYVVPPNRHVLVEDGTVRVEQDHADRPRPSVDLLLSSAARSYGDRLVAVILTGSGSDGAAGAVDVKHAGGTVVIQNPRTARFPSMPLALPPTAIDHVVDIDQMGAVLQQLLAHPTAPSNRKAVDEALQKIVDLVSQQSGVDFRPYKTSTVLRRVGRRMTANGVTTIEDYARHVEDHPEEAGHLANSLLINVTEFFRDPDAFLFLRNTVIPDIIERARPQGKTLRLWSAGCSTGEEAFSLVISVADLLGSELPEWNVRVFATDVDEQAVAFARRALYPPNVVGSLPEDYRARFFERTEQGLRVNKALRQMVIFGSQDIGHGVPFPRIDLVVCRNLLIYFRQDQQQGILDLFAYALHQSGGYLFLGKAETARPSRSTFELVNRKYKVYRCLAAPRGGLRPPGPRPRGSADAAVSPPAEPAAPAPDPEAMDVSHLRRFNDVILRAMMVGVITIDRSYRMITSNPAARRLLQIHEHAGEPDFLHAVRGIPYNEVRSAIDTAFRDRSAVTLPDLLVPAGPDERFVQLTVSRIQADASPGEYAVMTVVDVTQVVSATRHLQVSQEEQRLLVDELSGTNRRLGDLNKDLQDANEELQAANEELMLAQEELQATNEEFEATNEELQATNEELETNNEEMQATNEELETTNEELSSRSAELHDMTRILGSERARLSEMVELAPFPMMVLKGSGLMVEAFNPASTRVLANEEALHHPFEEVFASETVLLDGVRGAYRDDTVWTSSPTKVRLRSGGHKGTDRVFVFTAVPSHEEGKVAGVVLYGEDVTGFPSAP